MNVCDRTATQVALTGVGVCMCSHKIGLHGADGCMRCAARYDRPRAYRCEPARYDPRRSPQRQQAR